MGWRLIKGWESPLTGKFEPQELKQSDCVINLYASMSDTTYKTYYTETEMISNPKWFQFTPDLPEGWVRPEDTDASYGWVCFLCDGFSRVEYGVKSGRYDWEILGFEVSLPNKDIKAIYPLQKPRI